jgi:hypothetical protein
LLDVLAEEPVPQLTLALAIASLVLLLRTLPTMAPGFAFTTAVAAESAEPPP